MGLYQYKFQAHRGLDLIQNNLMGCIEEPTTDNLDIEDKLIYLDNWLEEFLLIQNLPKHTEPQKNHRPNLVYDKVAIGGGD